MKKKNFLLGAQAKLIVLITLGILLIGIPCLIYKNTIYTTVYVFTGVILYFSIIISIVILIGKGLRVMFSLPPFNFLEIVLSIIIYIIAFPIITILGLMAILAMSIYPKGNYFIIYILAVVSIYLFGVRITFYGSLPKEKDSFILVLNHTSFIDYILILVAMGVRPYNVVAGSNLHYIPILGYFLKKYAIGVDRKNRSSLERAYFKMLEELKNKKNIGIFPEGGRTTEKEISEGVILKEFKNGAFRAAEALKIKIVPVILNGTKNYAPKEKKGWWYVFPTKAEIRYLEPVFPDNKTMEQIKLETFQKMFQALNEF